MWNDTLNSVGASVPLTAESVQPKRYGEKALEMPCRTVDSAKAWWKWDCGWNAEKKLGKAVGQVLRGWTKNRVERQKWKES